MIDLEKRTYSEEYRDGVREALTAILELITTYKDTNRTPEETLQALREGSVLITIWLKQDDLNEPPPWEMRS